MDLLPQFATGSSAMKLRGLYRKSDTGIWYYQPPMIKGVRPRAISLETKDLEEATEAYFRTAENAQREFSAESVRMEAVRFLRAKSASGRHTARTTEETEAILEQFIAFTKNPPIKAVRPSHILAWRDAMAERNLSPATIKTSMGRISAFFTWAVRDGLIDEHPCKRVDMPRATPTRTEKYCTREERDRIIAAAPADRLDLQAALWLGFFAGLRRLEISEAHRDWVDLAAGVLHVKRTATFLPKGKRDRMVRISPRLAKFLAHYLEAVPAVPGSPYLIRPDKLPGKVKGARGKKAWRYRYDVRRSFTSLCTSVGLPWVNRHTMRHTFATLHAIAGTPLSVIAKELGDDAQLVFNTYVGYTRHGDHAGAAD